eukprot:6472663-Amphidinium_carterae.1
MSAVTNFDIYRNSFQGALPGSGLQVMRGVSLFLIYANRFNGALPAALAAACPKRMYKWIHGTVVVWDLAIRGSDGFALTPDDAAKTELEAWSKLWRPGSVRLRIECGHG